ncbi:hypothetical protein EM868_00280 [Cupriavidus gilardii]|uniref:hypothetical protein n=1 Tax=Cupriavidus gilardii TaxID=82541 RepID=UPI001EE5E122|nr:hypothetical protein [Cupriavidus gilardii]MCG5260389.1 hypothetical protein [Cupriavidus gilardii]MDF9428240.1 hypothetical protein [Cupriavidus gilardii]
MDKHTTSQDKGLAGWIEVFRAGSHVASDGKRCEFTQADLDQMVANQALGAAPAVLGHPKDNDPAYAWTSDIKREGDRLFVKFTDINPDFAKGVQSGAYRNRSVSVYKDGEHGWRLRHVGWLGATPPAIDGLRPVQFSDGQEALEFAMPEPYRLRWAFESMAGVLRRLRESVIAEKGQAAADALVSNWEIDSLADVAADLDTPRENNPAFSKPGATTVTTFTQADLDRARQEGEAQGRQAAAAEFSQQVTDANARASQAEGERRAARIQGQIDGWVREGKVTPAEKAGLAEFMAQLETGAAQSFEFSAHDGQTASKTTAQWFADFMASRAPVVKLGAGQDGGEPVAVDPNDAQQLASAAHEYMKAQEAKGMTVSYADAVMHVSKS